MPAASHHYPFLLDAEYRSRGVSVPADLSRLIARLNYGLPVRIGLLGSSVGEQGGCFAQPGKECQRYDGISLARPGWGKPDARPFQGWLVKFFHWLNATWPHPEHSIYNGANSAKPLHAALPCLDLYAPPNLDLIVMEPLSVGVKSPLLEKVVRHLLSRRPPPTMVFVNVPLWYSNDVRVSSKADVALARMACGTNRRSHAWFIGSNTTRGSSTGYRGLETHVMELCRRYSQSCLSM